jgi:pimeloyl-ACP methyl ester carboxylesterase
VSDLLIAGSDRLMASRLVSSCLAASDRDRVWWATGDGDAMAAALVERAVARVAVAHGQGAAAGGRLERVVPLDGDASTGGSIAAQRFDEAWYLGGAIERWLRPSASTAPAAAQSFAAFCADRVGRINYVFTSATPMRDEDVRERMLVQLPGTARERGTRSRMFLTPLLLGEPQLDEDARNHPLLWFFSMLAALKGEIDRRLPQYFTRHVLRFRMEPAGVLHVLDAGDAADALVLGRQPADNPDRYWRLPAVAVPIEELCRRAERTFGVPLRAASGLEEMNSVDRLFQQRLDQQDDWFAAAESSHAHAASVEEQWPQATVAVKARDPLASLEAVRASLENRTAVQRSRMRAVAEALQPRQVLRRGGPLTYYASDSSGPTVVLINALGHRLEYWYPLLDRLLPFFNVITWETRGLASTDRPHTVADHVDDLIGILQAEDVERCHVIGWCTGGKMAIEFYTRGRPVAMSLALLNCSFAHRDAPGLGDTPYERHLASVCGMLTSRPQLAGSLKRSLDQTVAGVDPALLDEVGDQLPSMVLSFINSDLRSLVMAPFATTDRMLRYAQQMLDFWSFDARTPAGRVDVPVLLLGGQYDTVASPESSRTAAALFRHARYVELAGGNHYSLYEHPGPVADLLTRFFADPSQATAFPTELVSC